MNSKMATKMDSVNFRLTSAKLSRKAEGHPGPRNSVALATGFEIAWFDQPTHIGRLQKKPTIFLKEIMCNDTELRGIVKKMIIDGKLSSDVACYYLYKRMNGCGMQLDEDWISYDVIIGKSGDYVTPWNILDVSREEVPVPNCDTTHSTTADDIWMTMYILSIYRIRETPYGSHYRDTVTNKIQKQLGSSLEARAALKHMPGYIWGTHEPTYRRMVAAIDMFLVRFPKHTLCNLRVATIGSRFRHCSALLSLDHINDVLGLRGNEILHWIFKFYMRNEINRMMKGEDEIEMEYSYFPYQIDLALVKRSVYSSVANPTLYFFIHAVCAMLGSKRSKNAHSKANQNPDTLLNAQIVAFVYKKKRETLRDETLATSATKWLNVAIRAQRYEPTSEMKLFFAEVLQELKDSRAGTVGRIVYDMRTLTNWTF